MFKKIWKYILLLFLSVCLVALLFYLGVVFYYKDGFLLNTWINGIYCTGKTVEEVNTELLCNTEAPFLTIIGRDGTTAEISLADADYKEDYLAGLQACISFQNSFLWPTYLTKEQHVKLYSEVSWDEEKLKNLLLALPMVKEEICDETSVDVRIQYTENGYELYDGMQGVFDAEVFVQLVMSNAEAGIYTTDLADGNCYVDREDSPQQAEERAAWEKLKSFLDTGLVYDMGAEQIVLDKKITSNWVLTDATGEFVKDAEGNFQWNLEAVEQFIEELAVDYNTCGTTLNFCATDGEMVEVPYVTYGTELDTEAEKEYLKEALWNNTKEVHIPTYIQEGYVRGLDDIGDTYIEVDMTDQKLYGYKAGELIVETDIVTGNVKRKWSTPEGVNYVYNKQKNRILRGDGYATPVDYWMPVKGAIGIHDADWRSKFGGDIYLTNGSHGCINVPVDVMPTIYEEFEIGTPVIMFY